MVQLQKKNNVLLIITAIMSANTVAEIRDKILTCSCISLKFLVTLTECGCPLAMLRW